MNFIKSTVIAATTATMFGCASAPPPKSDSEIANAYYGRKLDQSECQEAAKRSIGKELKDPYSAQYRFTDCRKNYLNQYGKYYFGYHIGGLVNAKNGYGGYVGETRFDVIIQDGTVIARCIAKANHKTGCSTPYSYNTHASYAR